jgi:hypothetical protein
MMRKRQQGIGARSRSVGSASLMTPDEHRETARLLRADGRSPRLAAAHEAVAATLESRLEAVRKREDARLARKGAILKKRAESRPVRRRDGIGKETE